MNSSKEYCVGLNSSVLLMVERWKKLSKESQKQPVGLEKNQECSVLETKCEECFREGVWSVLSNTAYSLNKVHIDHYILQHIGHD